MNINEIRKEIDDINCELVKSFEKRLDLVGKIGKIKAKNGISVYDKKREDEIIENMSEYTANKAYVPYVRQFARCMLTVSRKLQSDMIDLDN